MTDQEPIEITEKPHTLDEYIPDEVFQENAETDTTEAETDSPHVTEGAQEVIEQPSESELQENSETENTPASGEEESVPDLPVEGQPVAADPVGEHSSDTEEQSALQNADLTAILDQLTYLQEQMKSIREDFNAKLRYDISKKEIIDRQYQELDAYHREVHEKLSKAIIMDIISEIDGAERSAEHYGALEVTPENYAKLKKLVLAQAEDLRDLLENNDIVSYRTEAGEPFNHRRHSVLKTIPTDDPSLGKTIQASLRWGFEKDGKVVRPEKVAVYIAPVEKEESHIL